MTEVERYVAVRGEHYKLQIGRGDYSRMPALKKEANAIWAKLSREERREASEAYFVDNLRISKELPR